MIRGVTLKYEQERKKHEFGFCQVRPLIFAMVPVVQAGRLNIPWLCESSINRPRLKQQTSSKAMDRMVMVLKSRQFLSSSEASHMHDDTAE